MAAGEPDEAFCVDCGAEDPLPGGRCAACVEEKLDVVKGPSKPITLERCAHCGSFEPGHGVEDAENVVEAVEQAAVGSVLIPQELEDVEIGVRTHRRDPQSFEVLVEAVGRYAGEVAVRGEAEIEVAIETISCEACSKRHGGYYEAIVQVRYEGEEEVSDEQAGDIAEMIEEEVRRAGGLSGSQSYLLKATPKHGGYDYYFGAKPVAKSVATRIADTYGGEKNHSTTLAGRKDGEDFHRLTISVRIPKVRPGSVVGFDDEVIRVHGRHGNRLVGKTVPDGEGRTIEKRETDRAEVLDTEIVEVVYNQGGEGQVLDPLTLDSINVRLPQGVEAGDELEAVRYRGNLYVLGELGFDA
jgi:nonsense-mediated mRNA decay protein 3